MDPTLRSLLRPRHLLLTSVVFLALGGLAGAVVGTATAAAPDDSIEGTSLDSFTLPLPFVGDAGRYEVQRMDDGMAVEDPRTGTLAIDFQWYDDQVVRDEAGVARWANVVRVDVTEMRYGKVHHDEEIVAFHPGTPNGFAILRVRDETENRDDVDRTTVSTQTSFIDRDNALPCLFRNAFQGAEHRIPTGSLPSPAYCRIGPPMYAGEGEHLRGVAAAQRGEDAYLLARLGSSRMSLFGGEPSGVFVFRDDIPYPLQMRDGGADTAYVLTSFVRGTVAARVEAAEEAAAPSPLDLRPMQAWGPDDAGVSHPFPPSEALARLREDAGTGVAAFLAARPDAYVAGLYYGNMTDARDGGSNSWAFTLTDGKEQMRAWAQRREGGQVTTSSQLAPVLDPLGLEDPLANTTTEPASFHVQGEEPTDATGLFPLPAAVPALPTVASAMVHWRAYASPDFRDAVGNHWRLDLRCHEEDGVTDCGRAQAIFSVGHQKLTRSYDGPDDDEPTDTLVMSDLWWYSIPDRDDLTFAHPYFYSDQRVDWRPVGEGGADPGGSPRYHTRTAGLLAIAVGDVWAFPSARDSAVIGFGAFLGAALYWIWPLAKGGGIGLFSRVHKDRLLDNPLRQQLVARIESEPGIHHNALVRDLGKGKGAAEHHLDKLVDARLVLRHRGTGYTCYFPLGTDRRAMASAPAVKSDGARQVLDALRNGVPGVRGIAIATGLSPSTVSHHLERLRAAGLVTGDGRSGYHAAAMGTGATAAA